MKRQFLAILLCVLLLVSLAAPVYAVTPRSGSESKTIRIGNKPYVATAGLGYTSLNFGYATASLVDQSTGQYTPRIYVEFEDVTVRYETKRNGYINNSVATNPKKFVSDKQVLKSNYTEPPLGVEGYTYMNARVRFYDDTNGDGRADIEVYIYPYMN